MIEPVGDKTMGKNHIYCNIGEIVPKFCITGHDIRDRESSKLTSELREP